MMIEAIGSAAMLEQLAEEAAELAQAALKAARILRDDNPTPVTLPEACAAVIEEYTDVVQCAGEMGLGIDFKQMQEKLERFKKRAKAVRSL